MTNDQGIEQPLAASTGQPKGWASANRTLAVAGAAHAPARRIHRCDLRPATRLADRIRPWVRDAGRAPRTLCRRDGGAPGPLTVARRESGWSMRVLHSQSTPVAVSSSLRRHSAAKMLLRFIGRWDSQNRLSDWYVCCSSPVPSRALPKSAFFQFPPAIR
jgi:hypothetical protein